MENDDYAYKILLPLLRTDQPQAIGPVQLLPYERGLKPGDRSDVTQQVIDAMLSNYGDSGAAFPDGLPQQITRATLVEWRGDDELLELSDEDIVERLNIGQWIAFSALASRRYGSHFNYCNADDFYFVAQRFDAINPRAISTKSRRRDGYSQNYICRDGNFPIFLRPHHVQAVSVELDIP